MTQLPDYVVLDPAIDRLPPERLRAMQGERLRAMVRYVYDASPFWRRKFHEARIEPGDIRDLASLARIPFCTRKELQDDQARHPPFGSHLACEPARIVRFMTTSGTTGRPLRRVFSARDWNYALDRLRRNPIAGPGESVVMLGPVDGLMGPTASAESAMLSGALVVFAGLYDSRTKVRLLRDIRPSVVSGSASYLLHLIDVATEEGVDLPSIGLRTVVSVGEPGAAIPATRRRLLDGWGAFVRDGYGMTELFPLGGGCRHSTSLHIASDLVITEIVDPMSGEPLTRGEPGEVVYTNIVGDTQPLLRYRTGDVARLAGGEPCACGFTGSRLLQSIEGRVDDMIWLRGMNVFPSAIEAVLRGFVELDDEYEIVVSGDDLPSLTVRVELRRAAGPDVSLAARIAAALGSAIRASAQIELLPYGTLPRADARIKKRRVVRQRPAPSTFDAIRKC